MATFGKRFRKARDRRQKRRQEAFSTFVENRTQRIQARQTGKTERVGLRQQGKSDRIQSKSEGGFFLPQSVQARQDSLMAGLQTAGTIGMGLATGGASTALGAVGSALGNIASDSPYGGGFVVSGLEEEQTNISDRMTAGNIGEFINENPLLVGGAVAALLFILTRK